MKESISGNRSGARAGASSKAPAGAQRPPRRVGAGRAGNTRSSLTLHGVVAWMPLIGKSLFVICAIMLVIAGYRAVAAASFFRAASIDIRGAERASGERIAAITKRKAAATNVWQLNLDELSAEIEKEPWVRTAIVSRVLPGGLRVRITERTPAAVVRTGNGQLVWVDEDAVLLARVSPTDGLPPFFLRGYDETLTTAAQNENRRRIAEAIGMTHEWQKAGVVDRISEVNVEDLRDVRAQLAGRDAAVEVRLGASNYSTRLEKALQVLDEERNAPGGRRGARIVRLDATIEKRVIIGVGNGVKMEPVAPVDAPAIKGEFPVANESRAAASSSPTVTSAADMKRADVTGNSSFLRTSNTRLRNQRESSPVAVGRQSDERRSGRENESKEVKREPTKQKTTALAQRPRRVG